jgi:hypothetical protein
MMSRSKIAPRPPKPSEPGRLDAGTRIPLSRIEILSGPDFDRGRKIPPDVLAVILGVAEALWYTDAQGWSITDAEDISIMTSSLATMLGDQVGAGESLGVSGCSLLEHIAEELSARINAVRGVNPAYYAVVVREPVESAA